MKLKEYRLKNKFTQEEVAKLLNVSRSTYVYYESENISMPMDKFLQLCQIYKCSPNTLIGYDSNLTPSEHQIIEKAIEILSKK